MATTYQFVSYPAVLSGGGGGGGSVTWANEAPVGAINNVNTAFTIANAPIDAATFELFQDGLLVDPLTYTLAGVNLTMGLAPNFGQTLYCYYRKT